MRCVPAAGRLSSLTCRVANALSYSLRAVADISLAYGIASKPIAAAMLRSSALGLYIQRALPSVILVNQVVAVTCQFVQRTDPRFPLVYFTVDSALLAGLVAASTVLRLRWRGVLDYVRLTAAVGVVLSAVIFGAVIAPATPTGTWIQPHDDWWVRTATILMHGVAPVLVIADSLLRPVTGRWPRVIMATYSWPVCYLGVMTMVVVSGVVAMPYPFLLPSQVGWGTTAAAVLLMSVLVAVVGPGLVAVGRHIRR